MTLSKSQIDRLGERLKRGSPDDADLRQLDEYRSSLLKVYEKVTQAIREQLGLKMTGRERKTTQSIIEKLRRQRSMQLSQMQDIAGCRIVVSNVGEQDQVVQRIRGLFAHQGEVKVFDRRSKPNHGYRAVHLVVRLSRLPIEAQVRTGFQHRWAELSERLADELGDQTIKYGGGPSDVRMRLTELSKGVHEFEEHQRAILEDLPHISGLLEDASKTKELKAFASRAEVKAFASRAEEGARKSQELQRAFDSITLLLRAQKGPPH